MKRPLLWRAVRAMFLLLPLGVSIALADEPRTEKAFFWKVSSAKGCVYLLGSMHMAPPDVYPLPPEIEKAFQDASALVVEADVDSGDPAQLQKLVMERGMYGEGDDLSKHISKETKAALEAYCTKRSMDASRLEQVKPWLLSMSLEGLESQRLGFKAEDGIDMHFLKAAKESKKEVRELEGVTWQLDMLSGMPEDIQEKGLASTLSDMEKVKDTMGTMLDAWTRGDAGAMEKLIFSDRKEKPELEPVFKTMFDDRNAKMAEKIAGWLEAKDTCFVVVGAGHLVGEKGVVSLLHGMGYEVTQVDVTRNLKK